MRASLTTSNCKDSQATAAMQRDVHPLTPSRQTASREHAADTPSLTHHQASHSQVVLGHEPLAVRARQERLDLGHTSAAGAALDQELCNVLPASQQRNLQRRQPLAVLGLRVRPCCDQRCRDVCWRVLVVALAGDVQQRSVASCVALVQVGAWGRVGEGV